jgi:hypothetical protein
MTDNDPNQSPSNDIYEFGKMMDQVAAADPNAARELLRENPALAAVALSDAALMQGMAQAFATDEAAADARLTQESEAPGLFTELTRTLTPNHAEALYRKIAPLMVYELLRTLDRSADVGTVQRMVDHLCSSDVQGRLRACEHVRDGILDEIATVLRDAGVRDALDRDAVTQIMADCGVLGELATLENCVRLMRAQAG